jgi:hypothetical protein
MSELPIKEKKKRAVKAAKTTELKLESSSTSEEFEKNLFKKMEAKFENLEGEIAKRDEKLKKLEKKARVGPGFQKFGQSEWEKYENGNENVIFRSNYVDVQAMMGIPRK